MLSYMRKNASSWIIKVLFGIIVIVFVFFYGFSDVRKKKTTVLATVGEKNISVAEYMKAYKNLLQYYRNIYKDKFNDEMIKLSGLKQQALEQLIDREVLFQEADRLNITATKEQVQKEILNSPMFQENGAFSNRLYNRILNYYGMSPVDYEKDMEKELAIRTLQNMIQNAVNVSESELKELFMLQNEKITLDYVLLSPGDDKKTFENSPEEQKEYYEQHKEEFKVPEKIKVSYIVFKPEDFYDSVTVDEEELRQYYESDEEQFLVQEMVKARHILLPVDEKQSPEQQEAVRQKAQNLLEQLQQGASFEELAKKHSQDSATAVKGGDLGLFQKGDMVKPFEETAFSLNPGETSDLVKTQYGYHIIRVEDKISKHVKSFKEVRKDIEKDIRKEKAQEVVFKESRRAFNRLFKSRDLEEYSEKNSYRLLKTDFFAYGMGPEDTSSKKAFSEAAFSLSAGELAPVFAVGQNYILLKLEDRQEEHIPALQDVEQQITEKIEEQKRWETTRERASQILARLREGAEQWKDMERNHGLVAKETSFTRMGDYVQDVGQSKELKDAAFVLDETNPYPAKAFTTRKGVFIVKLKTRSVPDESEFIKDKEKTTRFILQRKKQERFNKYVEDLKKNHPVWVDNKQFSSV